jgi:hypothetical protein
VAWGLAGGLAQSYDILRDLDTEDVVDLINPEHVSGSEQRMIAEEAIEIP